MNALTTEKKALVLTHLVEGLSIRSIERMTGITKRAILRVLVEYGDKAKEIQEREMVNIQSNFVQVDEIWTYVGKKQKQLTEFERDSSELGDQYVFVAIDSETKLVPSFLVGKRSAHYATAFMRDLQYRIKNRFQLSTDAFAGYYSAVDDVFGNDIDYGMVHKEYREENKGERRYSPAQIVRV